MTATHALTCDTGGCMGVLVYPPGHGPQTWGPWRDAWATRGGGDTCPGCLRGAGVDERGECPRCGGACGWHTTGYRCRYCHLIVEHPEEPRESPELD